MGQQQNFNQLLGTSSTFFVRPSFETLVFKAQNIARLGKVNESSEAMTGNMSIIWNYQDGYKQENMLEVSWAECLKC